MSLPQFNQKILNFQYFEIHTHRTKNLFVDQNFQNYGKSLIYHKQLNTTYWETYVSQPGELSSNSET